MTARYPTLQKALDLIVQPDHPCELCLLSGHHFFDPSPRSDLVRPVNQAAHRTATSISRFPGGPDRLPARNPTASRLRRTPRAE